MHDTIETRDQLATNIATRLEGDQHRDLILMGPEGRRLLLKDLEYRKRNQVFLNQRIAGYESLLLPGPQPPHQLEAIQAAPPGSSASLETTRGSFPPYVSPARTALSGGSSNSMGAGGSPDDITDARALNTQGGSSTQNTCDFSYTWPESATRLPTSGGGLTPAPRGPAHPYTRFNTVQ